MVVAGLIAPGKIDVWKSRPFTDSWESSAVVGAMVKK